MTTEINIKDKQAIITTLENMVVRAKEPQNTDYQAYLVLKHSIETLITVLRETK